jgi:hypothetical protein
VSMCTPDEQQLIDREGRPPWRQPGFRGLVILFSLFAVMDVALIVITTR